MLVDQLAESESFIQFANENQTAIRGDVAIAGNRL